MDMDLYGPELPPGYVRPADDSDDSVEIISDNELESQPKIIGPQCPRFLSRNENTGSTSPTTEILKSSNVIGPDLPPSIQINLDDESSSDIEFCGPMPTCSNVEMCDVDERRAEIEKRAEHMKNKLENKNVPVVDVIEREEWMTVPDTSRRNQLSAISQCLAPSSKSSSSKEKYSNRHSEKDKRTSEELKKYDKSKRSESLLEMHKKSKKKRDKEKKEQSKERKAFDRDEMGVRNFTKDQVNSVIDKAKYLNSRFAPGKNEQFL